MRKNSIKTDQLRVYLQDEPRTRRVPVALIGGAFLLALVATVIAIWYSYYGRYQGWPYNQSVTSAAERLADISNVDHGNTVLECARQICDSEKECLVVFGEAGQKLYDYVEVNGNAIEIEPAVISLLKKQDVTVILMNHPKGLVTNTMVWLTQQIGGRATLVMVEPKWVSFLTPNSKKGEATDQAWKDFRELFSEAEDLYTNELTLNQRFKQVGIEVEEFFAGVKANGKAKNRQLFNRTALHTVAQVADMFYYRTRLEPETEGKSAKELKADRAENAYLSDVLLSLYGFNFEKSADAADDATN